MAELANKLVGKTVSLICFGEYVAFIHFGESDHCRIESEAMLIDSAGNNFKLFPVPTHEAILMPLGLEVNDIIIDNNITIQLSNEINIIISLSDGYESMSFNINNEVEYH
jgi:hypothetical protein